jgi:hypothetical protein
MWWFEWLWGHIPWYVPAIVIIVAIGFCWQWIAPIWLILPNWARWSIASTIAVLVAIQYGRNRGIAGEQTRQKSLNEHATEQRDKINASVKAMPSNAVTRALERNGWMRD